MRHLTLTTENRAKYNIYFAEDFTEISNNNKNDLINIEDCREENGSIYFACYPKGNDLKKYPSCYNVEFKFTISEHNGLVPEYVNVWDKDDYIGDEMDFEVVEK